MLSLARACKEGQLRFRRKLAKTGELQLGYSGDLGYICAEHSAGTRFCYEDLSLSMVDPNKNLP